MVRNRVHFCTELMGIHLSGNWEEGRTADPSLCGASEARPSAKGAAAFGITAGLARLPGGTGTQRRGRRLQNIGPALQTATTTAMADACIGSEKPPRLRFRLYGRSMLRPYREAAQARARGPRNPGVQSARNQRR